MIDFTQYGLESIVILMAGVILYLLYYVYTKDSYYTRNIRSIATVVENLNQEIFYLKKKVKETPSTPLKDIKRSMSDDEIYQEIERGVYDMVQPLSVALEQMEVHINAIDAQIDNRLGSLESGVKQISIPSSIHANDDEKVITLYKQNVALETIAKELHLSLAEVEFVLKINKIK